MDNIPFIFYTRSIDVSRRNVEILLVLHYYLLHFYYDIRIDFIKHWIIVPLKSDTADVLITLFFVLIIINQLLPTYYTV